MSTSELVTSFDFDDDLVVGGGLDAVAASIATHAATSTPDRGIVIVVRPDSSRLEVVAGGVDSALRAAVSVVAASGNNRLWEPAEFDEIVEVATVAFPEVLRAAADGAGVTSAHVGIVGADSGVDAVAIWFESGGAVAATEERLDVLRLLTAAAERDAERDAEAAALRAEDGDDESETGARDFDPDDPSLDPVTGLVTGESFEAELAEFDADEAVVVALQLDDCDDLSDEDFDDVVYVVADRLCAATRAHDVIARIDDDRFAILIADVGRNDAMSLARRLHAKLADPIATSAGRIELTSTMTFAHEAALPDVEQLFDSALEALAGGRRTGRFVLAA